MTAPAKCGTPSGYQRHWRNHERPCLPCCDAHEQAKQDRILAPWRRAILAEAISRRGNPRPPPPPEPEDIDPDEFYEIRNEYRDAMGGVT